MKIYFNLDVVDGNRLRIRDLTQLRNEYLDEKVTDKVTLFNYHNNIKYKFSETHTINIVLYNTTNETTIVDVLVDRHDNYLDETYHDLSKDGFYTVTHIILPTKETALKFLDYSESKKFLYTYYIDGDVIYKHYNGESEVVDPSILLEVNTEDTNISRITRNTFSIYYLYECYIAACKLLFNKLNTKCGSYSKIDTFNRDFLWMTINVIKYHVDFKQFYEALRVLEEVNYCSGICKEVNNLDKSGGSGCGCNK